MRIVEAERSISAQQKYIAHLYGPVNEGKSVDYVFGYLSRTCGYLYKAVSDGSVVPMHFIRPAAWLMALSSKFSLTLEDAFTGRYPNICPYCVAAPCVCLRTGKKPVSYIPGYKVKEELAAQRQVFLQMHKPVTLDAAASAVSKIYPNNEAIWRFAGPYHHFAKLHEETSEVHEAYTKVERKEKMPSAVEEELADVLAWLSSAWAICFPGRSFTDEFVDYYAGGCPVCRKAICRCGAHASRPAGLVDTRVLGKLAEELAELVQAVPGAKADLTELQLSVDAAIESGGAQSIAVVSMSQTVEKLRQIKTSLNPPDAANQRIDRLIALLLAAMGSR